MDVAKKKEFIKNWILNFVDSRPTKADSLVIGIYNLYNRKNPFSIYFSQGKENVSETFVPGQVTRLSIIGSFVPSITYNFKI